MKRLITFSLSCFYFLVVDAQILSFQGNVVDVTTQTGIPYVNIGFPKYSIGTSSNETGEFVIKIPEERLRDSLVFSSIGYISYRIAVKDIEKDKIKTVLLKPNTINLAEFVVKSVDAKKIVKMILKKRSDNYATKPTLLQFFNRESLKEKNTDRYFIYNEGVLEIYKQSVERNTDRVRLVKGRKKNVSPSFVHQGVVYGVPDVVNGPNVASILDIIKNETFFILQNKQFNFFHDGYENIEDRLAYRICFTPKDTIRRTLSATDWDFYKGKFYVDTASYALVRSEFELSERGLAVVNSTAFQTNNPLCTKQRKMVVNYALFRDKWYFKSANVENDYVYRDNLLALTNKLECLVTSIKTDSVVYISDKENIRDNESLGQNIAQFDDSFWEDFNFIKENIPKKETELLEKEAKLLENQTETFENAPTKATANKPPLAPFAAVRKMSGKKVLFFQGDFPKAQKKAAAEKKFIFMDFYTDWCKPCKMMAAEAFNDEEIADLLNAFCVNLSLDAEKSGSILAQKYNVNSYPTTFVVDSNEAVVARNSGYGGVRSFERQIETAIIKLPNAAAYIVAKKRFQNRDRSLNFLLSYARLRQKLGLNTEKITDALITEVPFDSLSLAYQQFITTYAFNLESTTFDFMLAHKEVPIFLNRLQLLIPFNLSTAVKYKDKDLLRKILKANTLIINNPSLSEESNEQLALEFYQKTNNNKAVHESAITLMTKHYLEKLDAAKTNNQAVSETDYRLKIEKIGVYYADNIKDKKHLEQMAILVNKACEKHECAALLSTYSQLLYRLKDLEKAKALMNKAVTLSGNAKELVVILEKMNNGTF